MACLARNPSLRVVTSTVGSLLLLLFFWTGCASKEEKLAAHFERGSAYLENEEYQAAVIEFRNTIQIDPEYVAAHLKLGEVYIRLENYPLAYRHYSTVVRLDPVNIPGLVKLALLDFHGGKYGNVRAHLKVVAVHQPNHLDALYMLAAVNQAEKRFREAARIFQKIIDRDHRQRPAYLGLANGLLSQGELAQADAYFDRAAAIDIQNHSQGHCDDEFESSGALAFKPQFNKIFNKMVTLYLEQKNYDTALAKCDRQLALSGHPVKTKAFLFHTKGQILKQTSGNDVAEEHYRRALEISPDYTPAANDLAYLLAHRTDNLDEALSLARLAKAAQPRNAAVLDTLGWVYFRLARYDLAIDEFRKSLRKAPDHAIVHYHLGLAYDGANQLKSAIESLEKALALDPNFPEADRARLRIATLRKRSKP
jgi:tetratricopeptide (TPR) repeat protein